VLAKTLALSIDPYLRNLTKDSYVRNEPMFGYGVGLVLRSESEKYKAGDHFLTNAFPFQEYAVIPESKIFRHVQPEGFAWSTYLGALGMPGQTAYVAYTALAKAKKGDTIYVSSGAGAVGSIVCQIAKAQGLRVIASAGSEDKVQFLREIGVDVAFNYKKEDLGTFLKANVPIDIYWDSVGGQSLETVIDIISEFGRIVSCGSISQYNRTGEAYGIKNGHQIYDKTLTISGFRVLRLSQQVGDLGYRDELAKLLREGTLKVKEDVRQGLKEAPQLFLDVQKGHNVGKAIISVADA